MEPDSALGADPAADGFNGTGWETCWGAATVTPHAASTTNANAMPTIARPYREKWLKKYMVNCAPEEDNTTHA
jgi:hypothetical protein